MLLKYKDKFPVIDGSVFIAGTAVIIGDVCLERYSSVWFNSVIRGDVNFIRIGERTNIQDGCVLHVTHNKYSLTIGADVTIGHNATVHGCVIKDDVLIGMGAVILDNALVNSNSVIAAGSVVRENFTVPQGVLAAGVPAKIIRDLSDVEIKNVRQSALNYAEYAKEWI
ncbi:MAG: gamma carbonic anhydrase family protein [bacterium]